MTPPSVVAAIRVGETTLGPELLAVTLPKPISRSKRNLRPSTLSPASDHVVAPCGMALERGSICRAVARLFRAQTLLSGQPFSLKSFRGALLGRS